MGFIVRVLVLVLDCFPIAFRYTYCGLRVAGSKVQAFVLSPLTSVRRLVISDHCVGRRSLLKRSRVL